jgi:hypothetical protein
MTQPETNINHTVHKQSEHGHRMRRLTMQRYQYDNWVAAAVRRCQADMHFANG